MPALELAIRANPKWAEPQFKIAALEADPARKIARLKMAASLAPRNAVYWQTLATAQAAANLYADAEKSWTAAERAAGHAVGKGTDSSRETSPEKNRAEFEAAKAAATGRRGTRFAAREGQRRGEIRAVEQAANQCMAPQREREGCGARGTAILRGRKFPAR